ncbi:transposable element Tcb2 transposase [Trichonephila clavipes]|nr:transposable element Tcb2 transposase [Trichonephila clavipes]
MTSRNHMCCHSCNDIFQKDNARPHTARVSQDCRRTVTTLPWIAWSLDLSPIEHYWYHLGRRVGYPKSLNELEARLQQIWNEMSRDTICPIISHRAFALESVQLSIKSSVLLLICLK